MLTFGGVEGKRSPPAEPRKFPHNATDTRHHEKVVSRANSDSEPAGDFQSAPRVTRVPVGDTGALTFLVPTGWEYKMKQQTVKQKNGQPLHVAHIRFRARDHYVQMTAVLTGFAGKDRKEWARKAAQGAGSEHLAEAVETSLAVENISGAQAIGAYFTLTDKSLVNVSTQDLESGQYKVMTQGALAVGDLSIPFTILGNDKDSALRRDILKMLSTATYKPNR